MKLSPDLKTNGKEQLLKDVEPAADSEVKSGAQTSILMVSIYIIANISCSVGLVMSMKTVFATGFCFPLTVNFATFVFTYVFFAALKQSGAWAPSSTLPHLENLKVALAMVGSISFMNFCLLTNTVAIYQICKFAVIPTILVVQKLFFNVSTNWRVLLSLAVVLGGVGYSSITGFTAGNLSVKGLTFACLAVVSTAVYRIWQESKQKEFKVGPVDFQATLAPWQVAAGLVFAVAEFFPTKSHMTVLSYFAESKNGVEGHASSACTALIGTCVCALLVNFTSFSLIGKTGPVAYAVVGHAKTALTILMGFIFFPTEDSRTTMVADVIGCAVAMLGVIAYGHFEYCLRAKKADLIQRTFPSLCATSE